MCIILNFLYQISLNEAAFSFIMQTDFCLNEAYCICVRNPNNSKTFQKVLVQKCGRI
uniref:Uncharacterized protein n=1 Tax=Anguilla anguilla TaxID=7936 RepID=A0A0E9UIV8_ANGAN